MSDAKEKPEARRADREPAWFPHPHGHFQGVQLLDRLRQLVVPIRAFHTSNPTNGV